MSTVNDQYQESIVIKRCDCSFDGRVILRFEKRISDIHLTMHCAICKSIYQGTDLKPTPRS